MISKVLRALGSLILGVVWLLYSILASLILFKKFLTNPWRFLSQPAKRNNPPNIDGMESIYIATSRSRLHALRNINHASWKPLMLFLHGFPENSYSWRNQLKYFRDTHTVVALDMRGFGESDVPRKVSDYSMDSLCLDVVATIKACGYESCVLIGHDWGGMVAWNVSANFPKMITRLITICSPHPRAYSEKQCFTLAQAVRSSYFMLFATPWLPEMYLRHSQGIEIRKMMLEPPMGVVSPEALTEQEVEFYVSRMLRPNRLTAGLNYYRNAMFLSSTRALHFVKRTITVMPQQPTLQLYGDRDAAFTVGMFENCSVKHNVELIKIQNCSHWAQQDCPDIVNTQIDMFTKQCN